MQINCSFYLQKQNICLKASKTDILAVIEIERMTGITGFLFLLFKPLLFLTLKKLFKKQMKTWIISALEWLALQTDNDIDDVIVRRVKEAMKLGVV